VDARAHRMKRFVPYFALLREVKFQFAGGLLAGVFYAALSGFGMPFMIKFVFPLIFGANKKLLSVQAELSERIGAEEANRLLSAGFGDQMKNLHKTLEIRGWFAGHVGADNAAVVMIAAACLLIPLTALLRGLAGYLNVYLITRSGLVVLTRIQQKVFEKLQRLPLGFFSGRKTGDLMSRVMNDSNLLQGVVTVIANDIIKQPFTLISALTFLAYESFKNSQVFFLLLCLLSIPVCALPIRMIGKRLMRRAAAMQRQVGDNSAVLAETLGATREIRAFNLEKRMENRFMKGLARRIKFHLKVVKYRYIVPPGIETISATVVAVAMFYSWKHGMTLEQFLPLVAALYMCYEPMKKLGDMHNRMKQGEASLNRIEEILDAPESVPDPPDPVPLGDVMGAIEFKNVDFSYGEEIPALRGISLKVRAGEIVALVGPSGAGKTTFASMIPRFYDPDSGRITLDGVDLRDAAKRDLRDKITLVPQEAILFSGTVEENIALGRDGASPEEIRQAARRAHAHDFILELPHGYETQVGERGAQLSGGQKQRISMARAFLKDAPVLILDEATSALDSESEARIQEQLNELTRGRTTFIIAHRFSTIRIADRIVVFDNSRIVGDGTFEELEDSHELFQLLLRQQER
jgi:subfamily B ATP-binding cassette protein MsbA